MTKKELQGKAPGPTATARLANNEAEDSGLSDAFCISFFFKFSNFVFSNYLPFVLVAVPTVKNRLPL